MFYIFMSCKLHVILDSKDPPKAYVIAYFIKCWNLWMFIYISVIDTRQVFLLG
jgi:hypothetical protein